MPPKDTKSVAALSNRSLVFEAFAENEKLTTPEVAQRVNEMAKARELLPLSERTVRRSIESLVELGSLKVHGRQNNAILYGKLSASFADEKERLVNFGGEFLSVEDFLKLVVAPDMHPLQKSPKLAVTSTEIEHQIRRRLAFVIWSAGNPGLNGQLQNVMRELHNALAEYRHAANLLQAFLDSPVWYEQYRDKIGMAMRKVQEKNPELFDLTDAYVKGG